MLQIVYVESKPLVNHTYSNVCWSMRDKLIDSGHWTACDQQRFFCDGTNWLTPDLHSGSAVVLLSQICECFQEDGLTIPVFICCAGCFDESFSST